MKTVIYIDVDNFYLKFYREKLKGEVEFMTAKDGKEGWKKIIENKPDLVITEIPLPYQSGFKIINKMNERNELKDIPVIVFTELSQDEDREEAMQAGVSDYIVKTKSNNEELLNRVKEILNIN